MADFPMNAGAEMALLSSLIKAPASRHLMGELSAEYFELPIHKSAFEIVSSLIMRNVALDPYIFESYFRQRFPGIDVSGLTTFINCHSTPQNFATYYTCVKEQAMRRKAIIVGELLKDAALKGTSIDDLTALVNGAGRDMIHMLTGGAEDNENLFNRVQERLNNRGKTETRYFTGLDPVDRNGGYGNIFKVVAARYGVGKTPYALRIALHNAVEKDIPVIYWSGENSNEEIMMAMMSMMTDIPLRALTDKSAVFTQDQLNALQDAQIRIQSAPLYFLPWGRCSVYKLEGMFEKTYEKVVGQTERAVCIIDQAPHIEGDKNLKSKNDQCDAISDHLFSFKKSMPALWITLAQLKTKGVEDEPALTDLMWFTRLEQNADVGVILDRPASDPKRAGAEQQRIDRNLQTIRNSNRSPEEKRQQEQQYLEQTGAAGRALIRQQKGRLGYGRFDAAVNFDEQARGFWHEFVIPPGAGDMQPTPQAQQPHEEEI